MDEDRKLFITALVIILGGNASGILNAVNPEFRNDPFTGRDGAELRTELHEDINNVYRYIESVRREDAEAMEQLRARITKCEYSNKLECTK